MAAPLAPRAVQGVLSSRVPEADQAATLASAALGLLRRQLAEPFDLTLLRQVTSWCPGPLRVAFHYQDIDGWLVV